MSDVVRSKGACSWSMTTKSKPASPMISVAWPVGVFRKVPISSSRAIRRWRKEAAEELMIDFWVLCRLRHRIIVGVQHPAGLLREIHPRGAENVDELVFVAADRFRRVDRRRRDDGDRGRTAQFMIVGAPEVLVNRPRPAQMVDELTLDRERTLLEIIMMMRRELGSVTRPLIGVEEIDHECRAAPDAAEAAFLRGHIEAVDAQLVAAFGLGPGLEQRDMRLGGGIRGGIAALGREVSGARGEHAHDAARRNYAQA